MPRPAPTPSPSPTSNANHSPGPWVVAKSGVSVDAGHLGPRIRQESTGPREVLEANARLIAAAPEILDALKRCVAFGVRSDSGAIIEREMETVRAAIAKAEGR